MGNQSNKDERTKIDAPQMDVDGDVQHRPAGGGGSSRPAVQTELNMYLSRGEAEEGDPASVTPERDATYPRRRSLLCSQSHFEFLEQEMHQDRYRQHRSPTCQNMPMFG